MKKLWLKDCISKWVDRLTRYGYIVGMSSVNKRLALDENFDVEQHISENANIPKTLKFWVKMMFNSTCMID